MKNKSNIQFAAAYIRVSTNDQTEYSPQAQRKALETYAKNNGYVLNSDNIFVDEGISGRKAEKRPAFMRMIAKAKSKDKPFDVILVHKFDRFARSREDSVVYKSLLKKECGVRVISITESIEDDKFSIILEAMLEAMAEYYSINLSGEVKKGMTEKHSRGEIQSAPPFGYYVENNQFIPHPDEAPIVKEIYAKFVGGMGCYPISRWLNSMGVKTHRNNNFENRTVEYIIRNPVYIGKLRWTPTGWTQRKYDNPDTILVDGKHEALIDNDTWETAQQRIQQLKMQHKYHSRPIESKQDWLSGLVYCANCGKTLVFVKPHYWKCNGYVHSSCTKSQHIRDDILKDAILQQLKADAASGISIQYSLDSIKNAKMDELSELELKLNKINQKIKRVRDAYLDGIDTVAEYKETKTKLENEAHEIRTQMEKVKSKSTVDNPQDIIKSSIANALNILMSESASMAEKHNAAHNIIDKCVWDKEKNTLKINYHYIFV